MFCGCGVVRCFPFPSPAKWRSWGGKKKDGRCCWENNNNKQNNNRKLEKEGEKRSDETSKRKQSQPKQKSECAEWLAVQRQSGALRDNTNTRGKGEWRNKTKNKKQQQKIPGCCFVRYGVFRPQHGHQQMRLGELIPNEQVSA